MAETIWASLEDKRHARTLRQMGPEPGRSKFVLEHIASIRFDPKAAFWTVKGLLPAEGLACIYGRPKSYKSFIVTDLSLAIARGLTWAGRKVRRGAVVYIGCEGALGIRKRLHAYKSFHGLTTADFPFLFIDAKPNLGVSDGDAPALIAAVDEKCEQLGVRPVLITVDTLSRTLQGAAENAEGMVHFCDNAEQIGRHFSCPALAVHHSGKNTESGMRGHSSLLGAVVTSWRVEKIDDLRARVTVEASKDGEDGISWDVRLTKHTFEVDEDGEDVSSLVVEEVGSPTFEGKPANRPEPTSTKPPPQAKAFLQAFEEAIGASGAQFRPFIDGPAVRGVDADAVRTAYYAIRGDEVKPEAKQKAFRRALALLVERRFLNAQETSMGTMLWRT